MHGFSSNLQNRHSFIQTILMSVLKVWRKSVHIWWSYFTKCAIFKFPKFCLYMHVSIVELACDNQFLKLSHGHDRSYWTKHCYELSNHINCIFWHHGCVRHVRIYDLYGLKACSDILSNNFCHVHLTILKIGCHRLTQQCWHACTNEILEIWKLHVLWNNLIKCAQIFFKPSEQMFFYPDDSNEGLKPYAHTKTTHVWNLVCIKKVEYLT